jgi:hypothetical protein
MGEEPGPEQFANGQMAVGNDGTGVAVSATLSPPRSRGRSGGAPASRSSFWP